MIALLLFQARTTDISSCEIAWWESVTNGSGAVPRSRGALQRQEEGKKTKQKKGGLVNGSTRSNKPRVCPSQPASAVYQFQGESSHGEAATARNSRM
jgi:hypothetical protein